ncbi:NAD(P)-dependent dehydrogenase (short-subunit alcohol dehydrogenase family) [Marmoricola sp. OAE513]|uniref:SDR family NAD(P)-dependent oxidoreductase n=1 Tax=Marmoricola sp. OAE513 TaxID=2817894 RepID=UPI001AE6FE4C
MSLTTVVIGGASGIGRATVEDLRAHGHTVVVADITPGDDVIAVDVADEDSVAALFDRVLAEHGSFTGVVNCAGVSTLGAVIDHDAAEFRRVVDVCLTGAFLVLKHAGRRVADGGSLVTLSSLNGRQPGGGLVAYCSAKAGVNMLTEVAALELAHRGIRVNSVAPGLVVTPLTAPAMDIPGIEDDYLENTPLGRSGEPSEIAAALRFLLSDDSRWITGESLDINGGAHLKRYPDLQAHVMKAFG